jgi:hypothetical protein
MASRLIVVWILIVEGMSIHQLRTAKRKEFVIEDAIPAQLHNDAVVHGSPNKFTT